MDLEISIVASEVFSVMKCDLPQGHSWAVPLLLAPRSALHGPGHIPAGEVSGMGNEPAHLLSLHVQADGMGLPKLCLVGVLVKVSRGEKEQ